MIEDSMHIDTDLLMAFLAGETNSEQNERVHSWLCESNENRIQLDELEKVWLASAKLVPAPVSVDVDKAWRNVQSIIAASDSPKQIKLERRITTPRNRYYLLAAATIIILLGVFSIMRMFTHSPIKHKMISQNQILVDTLPDGSSVTLNKNTVLEYYADAKSSTRTCNLKGEAFFNVVRDTSRPFLISAKKTTIEVLGTSFNINATEGSNEVVVSVESGTVLFGYNTQNEEHNNVITLRKGEVGVFNEETEILERISSGISEELFWHNKSLIFDETQISKVMEILSSVYNVDIILMEKSLEDCRYSGIFRNESIDVILQVISESFSLTVTKEKNIYKLDGKGC